MRSRYILLMLPLLAACAGGEVRETLGLNQRAPDEFVVVSRPPLSVPPEFSLKPPKPGAPPRGSSTEDQARRALLGTESKPATLDDVEEPSVDTAVVPVLTSEAPSGGTAKLLSRAGADQASPDIRQQLAKEVAAPAPEVKADSLYEKIVGEDKSEPVVDAKGEAERLRKNKDEGKTVTEGETPTEDTKPKSVIDRIF